MSRRWIDPDLFTDEKLGKASPAERLLFIAMVANQDDDGRLLGHPGYLRSIAFPYDDFSNEEVKQMRDHLAEVNPNVIIYQNAGDEYIQLKRHYRYQRPRYYHPSKFPAPPGWPFKDEETAQPPQGNHTVAKQLPSDNRVVTEESLPSSRAVTKRYTEDRVGRGGDRLGSDLDTRVPSAPGVADDTAGAEIKAQGKPKSRLKPRQQEAGAFLDLVEKAIGARLVERSKLMNRTRSLLVKCPQATPEKLLQCFIWLRENDAFCRSRDSPTVIMMLPSKYPEWAAGKLPASGKEAHRGRVGKNGGIPGNRPAGAFDDLEAEPP